MNSAYGLCQQTVTVYRMQDGQVHRQVIPNCSFSVQEEQQTGLMGAQILRRFLLIVPGASQQVFVGDRIMGGIGPLVTAAQWADFIPSCVDGLVQVGYAQPFYQDGVMCHTEAGEKR